MCEYCHDNRASCPCMWVDAGTVSAVHSKAGSFTRLTAAQLCHSGSRRHQSTACLFDAPSVMRGFLIFCFVCRVPNTVLLLHTARVVPHLALPTKELAHTTAIHHLRAPLGAALSPLPRALDGPSPPCGSEKAQAPRRPSLTEFSFRCNIQNGSEMCLGPSPRPVHFHWLCADRGFPVG